MTKGAVVGFGRQGKRLFCAMRSLGIEIAAVCDINPEAFMPKPAGTAVKIWERTYPTEVDYGDTPPNFYTKWQEMIKKEKLEILSVATWTQDHASVIIEAAKSGVEAILCEKPISNSLESAQRMIRACEENSVLLTIDHTRRWWWEHQQIQKIVKEGVIGDLRHLWLSCGGARLGDLAVHFIDWMRWMTGSQIDHIIGYLEEINEPNPRGLQFKDHPGRLILVFQNGTDGFIHLGQNIALPPRYEIVGTKGRILIEEYIGKFDRWEIDVRPESRPLMATLDYYGKTERIDFPKTGKIEWKGMIVSALRELLEGKTSCDGEEGYKALEGLVATHLSHEIGHRPVRLPLVDIKAIQRKLPIA